MHERMIMVVDNTCGAVDDKGVQCTAPVWRYAVQVSEPLNARPVCEHHHKTGRYIRYGDDTLVRPNDLRKYQERKVTQKFIDKFGTATLMVPAAELAPLAKIICGGG